jgi:N-acetylglucosamine-6-phosphate deacetylase
LIPLAKSKQNERSGVSNLRFLNGQFVFPDEVRSGLELVVRGGRIAEIAESPRNAEVSIDLEGGTLVPGFIDLHVHGGDGADFMDGTDAAFRTVCRCHARHGTTSLAPTSTAARDEHILRFLERVRSFQGAETDGARVLGAHFYGPYFNEKARGCHPSASIRDPNTPEFEQYLDYADCMATATIAPELPNAEAFAHACRERGVRLNAGHSHATFEQMEQSIGWGVRHVDHLFCAMSDRAKLRQAQPFPMRGGVLEATLCFDELTTEVIADGSHLESSLLRLAYRAKGPDRLALVTDAMRAVDQPDGEYVFGPIEDGERVRRRGDVGVTLDGSALASGVTGMDHAVRTFLKSVPEAGLPEVIRMATLTPARILGRDAELGSLELGKRADLLVLDHELQVRRVFVDGVELDLWRPSSC